MLSEERAASSPYLSSMVEIFDSQDWLNRIISPLVAEKNKKILYISILHGGHLLLKVHLKAHLMTDKKKKTKQLWYTILEVKHKLPLLPSEANPPLCLTRSPPQTLWFTVGAFQQEALLSIQKAVGVTGCGQVLSDKLPWLVKKQSQWWQPEPHKHSLLPLWCRQA